MGSCPISYMLYREAPYYSVAILKTWYDRQRLFVVWGSCIYSHLGMSNGIRQGSLISPYLSNIYMLMSLIIHSRFLSWAAKLRPHRAIILRMLTFLAPLGMGLNELLDICRKFANDNLIVFSTRKTVVLLIHTKSYLMLSSKICSSW